MVDLSISVDKVCSIIEQARELSEEDLIEDPDAPGEVSREPETAGDDGDNPMLSDLEGFIAALTFDEQVDLVALMWMGRDDHTGDEWPVARREAAEAHNEHTADYLCGSPLLADHLSEGLSLIGHSCDDHERGRV